jgi:hypothetical protein
LTVSGHQWKIQKIEMIDYADMAKLIDRDAVEDISKAGA